MRCCYVKASRPHSLLELWPPFFDSGSYSVGLIRKSRSVLSILSLQDNSPSHSPDVHNQMLNHVVTCQHGHHAFLCSERRAAKNQWCQRWRIGLVGSHLKYENLAKSTDRVEVGRRRQRWLTTEIYETPCFEKQGTSVANSEENMPGPSPTQTPTQAFRNTTHYCTCRSIDGALVQLSPKLFVWKFIPDAQTQNCST